MSDICKLLSKAEVCELLGISLSTLDRIVCDGDLPIYRIRGSCKFKEADVTAYLESCREEHVHYVPPAREKRTKGGVPSWDKLPEYYPGMKVV